jgi:bleomycin hydrolase
MKFIPSLALLLIFVSTVTWSQPSAENANLTLVKVAEHTPVKDQGATGTCWSFSTVSLVESQTIKANLGEFDLSEMFVVRNIYVEKAKNYILRQGAAQFSPGGLGNDVIHAMSKYGAVPENVYKGIVLGNARHDHGELDQALKSYLDKVLAERPIAKDWLNGFQSILDNFLGKVPETFTYREKVYTPQTFSN